MGHMDELLDDEPSDDELYEDGIAPGAAWGETCGICGQYLGGSCEDDDFDEYFLETPGDEEVGIDPWYACWTCVQEALDAARAKAKEQGGV